MIGRELLLELRNSGWKFTEANIVFIAKDSEGKLVWLEKGNEAAGLEHIILRHKNDFNEAMGIQVNEIALHLYTAITFGTVIGSMQSKVPGGIDRIYEYDDCYYTFVGIGSNGFIVTAFPTQK